MRFPDNKTAKFLQKLMEGRFTLSEALAKINTKFPNKQLLNIFYQDFSDVIVP